MPRDDPSLLREDILTPLLLTTGLDLLERYSAALKVFLVQQDDRVAVLKGCLNLPLTVCERSWYALLSGKRDLASANKLWEWERGVSSLREAKYPSERKKSIDNVSFMYFGRFPISSRSSTSRKTFIEEGGRSAKGSVCKLLLVCVRKSDRQASGRLCWTRSYLDVGQKQ